MLCTLRLLRELGDYNGSNSIRCVTFGMPALGNAALADHVSLRGWHQCFSSFVLPGETSCRANQTIGSCLVKSLKSLSSSTPLYKLRHDINDVRACTQRILCRV